jgi:hypothetical protein
MMSAFFEVKFCPEMFVTLLVSTDPRVDRKGRPAWKPA